MNQQSWKASLWFVTNSPDFYCWIVVISGILVSIITWHLSFVSYYKSQKLTFKVTKIKQLILLSLNLLLGAMMVGLIILRIELYYGVTPFYTSYTWKLNLFTSFTLAIILSLWVYKGIVTLMFQSWKTDFKAWKKRHFQAHKNEQQVSAKKTKDKNPEIILQAPFSGIVKPLKAVDDQVFAKKIMGDGIAIVPCQETIYAPLSGTIESTIASKHAYGIRANKDLAILVHIGIDTIKLQGQGFESFVAKGDKVEAGQPIGKINLAFLQKQKALLDSPILLLPESKYQIDYWAKPGEIKAKTKLLVLKAC